MNSRAFLAVSLGLLIATVISYRLLDYRIAIYVSRMLDSVMLTSQAAGIPDLLLPFSCIATLVSWSAYFLLTNGRSGSVLRNFFLYLGTIVPITFVVKGVLKVIFGRATPMEWMSFHGASGLHWFHGRGAFGAFPSGHMAVFAAVILTLVQFYPKYSYAGISVLFVLGFALIATNHHFLSDVLAGFLLALILNYVMGLLLKANKGRESNRDRV